MLGDASGKSQLPPKVQSLLHELKSQMAQLVLQGDIEGDESPLEVWRGVTTPEDEVLFWTNSSSRNIDRDLMNGIKDAFDMDRGRWREDIAALCDVAASGSNPMDWEKLEELVDQTNDVLDAMWNAEGRRGAVYPQGRMAHFLGLLGSTIGQYVQRCLRDLNIWRGPFAAVRANLRGGIQVCERWINVVDVCTKSLWPNHASHTWEGEEQPEEFARRLCRRLEEILEQRTTIEELRRLLSDEAS